jgi:hypothetical protein
MGHYFMHFFSGTNQGVGYARIKVGVTSVTNDMEFCFRPGLLQ